MVIFSEITKRNSVKERYPHSKVKIRSLQHCQAISSLDDLFYNFNFSSMVKAKAFILSIMTHQGQGQGLTSLKYCIVGVVVFGVHSNLSSTPSGFLTYLSFLDRPRRKHVNKNEHLREQNLRAKGNGGILNFKNYSRVIPLCRSRRPCATATPPGLHLRINCSQLIYEMTTAPNYDNATVSES